MNLVCLCSSFIIPPAQFASQAGKSNKFSTFPRPAATVATTPEKVPNQILKFREPKTNVTVILVGAMHYNPSSIQLAEQTIMDLESKQQLGSVIVESCDIRWNKTVALYEKMPFLKALLKNEMVASSDLAQMYKRPVILGDQRINITTDSIKECFQQTVVDLTSPPSGWIRFAEDVGQAFDETRPFGGPGYLSAFAFFDPKLIAALPVSLFKYPLSFLVRDPVPTSILFLGFFGLNYLDINGFFGASSTSIAMDAIQNSEVPLTDWIASLFVAFLETVFFARAFLKPLLAERNEVLAKSILNQCQLLAGSSKTKKASSNPLNIPWPFGNEAERQPQLSEIEIVYASGSSADLSQGRKNDQTVVAILGMAHCNGIKKLLQEELVQ